MPPSSVKQDWDKYVTDLYPKFAQRDDVRWPGDEWGAEEQWRRLFEELFHPAEVESWKQALEIGQGAGKYTKLVFDAAPECRVAAFDVSSEYLNVCAERLSDEVEAGRLLLEHLKSERPDEMILALERLGMAGTLDAFFSIDAMVHVDLQYLMDYFLTAAVALREGGYLIMTLADATTDHGFDFLVSRTPVFYSAEVEPIGKFEWMSRDVARAIMERLGFEIVRCDSPPDDNGRDVHLVARLTNREAGRSVSWALEHELPEQRRRRRYPAGTPPVLEWPRVETARKYSIQFSLNRFGTVFDSGIENLEVPADADPEFRIPPRFWSQFQSGRPLFWRVIADCPDRLRVANRGIVVRERQ